MVISHFREIHCKQRHYTPRTLLVQRVIILLLLRELLLLLLLLVLMRYTGR